jgi:hypothetical protein
MTFFGKSIAQRAMALSFGSTNAVTCLSLLRKTNVELCRMEQMILIYLHISMYVSTY